jgi:broad specificity phosphatase PhoE
MKLIAIRHGETQWNTEKREMGQMNSPLTSLGLRQAEAIAVRLSKIGFAVLYSSDLGRAVQTAEIIASRCGTDVLLDKGLRERNMGVFEGLTYAEMETQFPQEWSDYQRIGFEYVIPKGESAKERLERSVRALTAIAERHPSEDVVVVTHGGFLMGFFEFVLGIPPGNGWRFKRHNASYSTFEYSDGKWSLETWNDVGHLYQRMALDDPTIQL